MIIKLTTANDVENSFLLTVHQWCLAKSLKAKCSSRKYKKFCSSTFMKYVFTDDLYE